MQYLPVASFLLSFVGSALGVYVGLRVAIARIEEQIKSINEKNADHADRLKRLEERVLFKSGSVLGLLPLLLLAP